MSHPRTSHHTADYASGIEAGRVSARQVDLARCCWHGSDRNKFGEHHVPDLALQSSYQLFLTGLRADIYRPNGHKFATFSHTPGSVNQLSNPPNLERQLELEIRKMTPIVFAKSAPGEKL
jgi:hypothetical protein